MISCKNGRSFQFWSYEWKKHDTCYSLELLIGVRVGLLPEDSTIS
jgi:hypothetical protein